MDSSMNFGDPYNIFHDEIMNTMNPTSLFLTSTNFSDTECSLTGNEEAVDLIKYLDSESDNVQQETISPEYDNALNHFLLSPTPARRVTQSYVGYGPTLTSINAGMLSGSFADPHWVISPEKCSWVMSVVKQETVVPPSPPKFNSWYPDQHIKEEQMSYLSSEDLAYLYGSGTSSEEQEEQPEEEKTKSDSVAGDESVDSYVDVELVDSHDVPMSTVMFEEKSPVAKTLDSPQSRRKLVFAARVVRKPKPIGRPRGSKKRTVTAAATGQASTSQSTLQPCCSTSNTETSSASRCVIAVGQKPSRCVIAVGQKRKFKCETVTSAPALPAYSPVLGNSFSVNFHDYAMSPLSPASPSSASSSSVESSMLVAPTRRPYRRNASLDVVDKDKQNHHNQLERNRRQKLADLFTDLRVAVPKIEANPKASKVLILNEAVSHINYLKHTDKQQGAEIFREEQKQRLLTNQLQQLRAKQSSRLK